MNQKELEKEVKIIFGKDYISRVSIYASYKGTITVDIETTDDTITFSKMLKLSKLLKTEEIDWTKDGEGCPTCGFGATCTITCRGCQNVEVSS
jgi:hypothetical protein